MLTRDEARAYFAACGLNYKDITLHELRYSSCSVISL